MSAWRVPTVDVAALRDPDRPDDDPVVTATADSVGRACRDAGFLTIVGHGVPSESLARLDAEARRFFALPEQRKAEVSMARAERAWRGWFPLGGELTSGVPDGKEGYYFGEELPADDPRVLAGRPLHGANLWPDDVPGLRSAVDDWMTAMTALGHDLARALGIALGLGGDWFARHLTTDPVVLFRIFRYPPVATHGDGAAQPHWGVAEHTDYGLLTLLAHDGRPGLEVRGPDGWVPVEAESGAIVVNLGDMLDRMTEGRYRSTPHRVRPPTGDGDRLSFPFFFDPSWDAEVRPLPLGGEAPPDDAANRWDGTSLRDLSGTYGDYLTAKVAKVFPDLAERAPGPISPG